MKSPMLIAVLGMLPLATASAATPVAGAPPTAGMLKVAFVISEHANVMDIAGPWEVFQDTSVIGKDGKEIAPFALYTVAPSKAPLRSAGRPGLQITPDYDFADAPTPDLVIVGAQSGGAGMAEWLRKIHAQQKTILSICTGAFKLAEAGLLDGKPATTHHWYFGDMRNQYPQVKLVSEVRYVEADPTIYTAGGLTSGVDLSLHVVAERFGQQVAQNTADYMEYQGDGWKSNHGISILTTPVTRAAWQGTLADGSPLVLHLLTEGASTTISADLPARKLSGIHVTPGKNAAGQTRLSFDIPGHPASFEGTLAADGAGATGVFVQDGRSTPLSLRKQG